MDPKTGVDLGLHIYRLPGVGYVQHVWVFCVRRKHGGARRTSGVRRLPVLEIVRDASPDRPFHRGVSSRDADAGAVVDDIFLEVWVPVAGGLGVVASDGRASAQPPVIVMHLSFAFSKNFEHVCI